MAEKKKKKEKDVFTTGNLITQDRKGNIVNKKSAPINLTQHFYRRNETPGRVERLQTGKNKTYDVKTNVSRTVLRNTTSDGYTDTKRKFSDYNKDDKQKADYKIYKKGNKYYYYDEKNKKYEKMIGKSTQTRTVVDKNSFNNQQPLLTSTANKGMTKPTENNNNKKVTTTRNIDYSKQITKDMAEDDAKQEERWLKSLSKEDRKAYEQSKKYANQLQEEKYNKANKELQKKTNQLRLQKTQEGIQKFKDLKGQNPYSFLDAVNYVKEKNVEEQQKQKELEEQYYFGKKIPTYETNITDLSPLSQHYGWGDVNQQTAQERVKWAEEENKYAKTLYEKNQWEQLNKETSGAEKVFMPVASAITQTVQGLDIGAHAGHRRYIDETGTEHILPSESDLAWERTLNSYNSKAARFAAETTNNVTKLLMSEALNLAVPYSGTAVYWTSMFGNSYQRAFNMTGGDEGKSLINALANTGLEFLTGKFLGSATKGVTGGKTSQLEAALSNATYKLSKNPLVSSYVGKALSEGTEEFLQEYLGNAVDVITMGTDGTHEDLMEMLTDPDVLAAALYSGAIGAMTSIGVGGAGNVMTRAGGGYTEAQSIQLMNTYKETLQETINEYKNKPEENKKKIKKLEKVLKEIDALSKNPFGDETAKTNVEAAQNIDKKIKSTYSKEQKAQLKEVIEKVEAGEIDYETANGYRKQILNGTYGKHRNLENIGNQKYAELQQQKDQGLITEEQYDQEINALNATMKQSRNEIEGIKPTDTDDKIQNFRNSIHNENVNDAEGFYKAAEKIIKDKDYNVLLDSSIKDEKGKSVPALISNENGITIKINPKYERAGEILLQHEVTHAVGTQEVIDLIVDYASKNSEFNEAVEELKQLYGTNEVTQEVAADISGQLFGYQEFIDDLSTKNPNLFKRIYEKIVEIANKLTGNSKAELFMRDLKAKWEKAYRNSTKETAQQNLKDTVKYSKNAEIRKNFDNEGNKLAKGVQNYFDKSYARVDEKLDGELVMVYHTNKYIDMPFYEFKPQVAPDFHNDLFENQTVIYATDSQKMSGSYAEMEDYVLADTHRYEKIEEVQEFLDQLNEIGHRNGRGLSWTIKDVSNDDYYKDYNKMLLALKFKNHKVNDPKGLYDRGLITKEEYENAITPSKYIIQQSGEHIINSTITFKSKDDLLRNWKNKLSEEINRKSSNNGWEHKGANKERWQYKGYMNIEKPYIVDSQGGNFKKAERELRKDVAESFDKMAKFEKELYDLAQESRRKYRDEFLGEKSRNLSNVKRIFNGISNEGIKTLYENGIIGTTQDYNKVLKAAENAGMEIPSYDKKVRDVTSEATSYTIDNYGNDTEKSMLDMSFGDFIKYSYDLFKAENDYGSEEFWFKKNLKNVVSDDIDTDVLTGWSWYKIADRMFNETSREDAVYKYLETNDVVAKILRENKNLEEKYDGVIFKNIVDYGHAPLDEHFNPLPYEEWEPATVYVVFNSNQFKAWDNKNPTKDPDMRYSKKADKWQKFLDKYFPERGTRTNLKEKIGAKTTTGQEGEEYWKNNGADTKVAKVLSEVPKDSTKTLMQKVKDGTATLGDEISLFKRKFVDKGEFIYKLAKKAKNRLLYAKFDKMGTAKAEAQFDIGEYQTNLKGKAFKNFVDKDGNKVAMSLNGIWDTVKGFEDAANEYLAHYLNVDRYGKVNEKGRKLQETLKKQVEEGKITQEKADEKWAKANESEIYKYVFGPSVTAEDSKKRIKELEKEHPELKLFGQNIWQYGKNQLLNRVQASNISKEAADNFMKETPHYVRLQRNVETKGEPAIKFDKNGKATINSQIKEFKGSTADILPFKESMAKYTEETIEAMRKNMFAQELAKTIGVSSNLSTVSSIDEMFGVNPELIKDNGDGTYSLTFFNNGVATTIPINEGIYEALQPNKHFDWEDRLIFKGIRKIDSLRRALLTDKNPMFLATNMMKDLFDAPLNSKYPVAFAKNYIKAIKEISSNGKYFQQYKALGGLQNTYFENGEFKNKNGVKGVASKLDVIGKANNLIEQLPRLAEFITTMEKTGNIDEAMYNAAEITTNFKRGGDITKALNRNGATFLNASVQGFSKQVRNFSDIQNPKQAVQMLAKAVILGIAPALLNDVMYDDDDEYKEMQEYQKDRYYLFKGKNGEWIRIPKGRAVSIFQSATRRTKYALKGDKKAYSGLGELIANQVAPNNPLENNIVSPIVDVKRNESWSGNPIVSDSIKNKKHPEEEYTIKTDEFSKWLGKKLHKSPAKINYLIDQYSGALGDITLPNITKNRKRDINNPVDIIANPFKDKFTTNAVTSSKAQNDFYEAFEDAESDKKWSKATAEDEARYKYLYAKNKEISDIRKSIYKMYESNKSTEEKYKYNISSTKEINRIAKEAVENSKKIDKSNKNQIKIGESFYAVSNGKATKVKGETVEKAKEWGIPITDYNDIVSYKYNARADKDANGKSIRGTAKQKVIKYVYSKKDLTEKQKKEIIKRLYKRNS